MVTDAGTSHNFMKPRLVCPSYVLPELLCSALTGLFSWVPGTGALASYLFGGGQALAPLVCYVWWVTGTNALASYHFGGGQALTPLTCLLFGG
jgi:hypothetical protein